MIQNKNKKAISDVIATVLLISLTIASVAIISSILLPYISEKANLAPAISCLDLKTYPPINIMNTCFNENTKDIEVKFQRAANNINISSMTMILRENQEVLSFRCDNLCGNCQILDKGKVKTYFFNFPQFKKDAMFTLSVDGCEIVNVDVTKKC